MIALLDSDIFAYRAAASCEREDVKTAKRTLDGIVTDVLLVGVDSIYKDCFVDKWELFLTGKNNFRYEIAKTAPYKGNRVNKPKPKHLQALREHLIAEWGAVVANGQEADDAISIRATELGDDCVIVSVDKDLDQISGWHYNFVKRSGYYIEKTQALVKFYTQMLTGDSADNIIGIYGIGPVKAAKILDGVVDEEELYQKVLEAYEGDEDRVIENGQLLFLRRQEGQLWTPPKKVQA